MTPTTVHVQGIPIAVRATEGAGHPIVLVHGNSMSSLSYQRQLGGALGRDHRLVAFDLPGHGASGRASEPDAAYTLPGYAETLVAVVETLGLHDAIFVGWSLGGHVVLEAAEALSEAAGFLVFGTPPVAVPPAMEEAFLPSPPFGVAFTAHPEPELLSAFLDGLVRPEATPPALFREDFERTDPQARAAIAASVPAGHLRDEVEVVRRLAQPLAVLHGAEDGYICRAYIEALEMPTLWRGEIQVVEEAGHSLHWERPAAFEALLRAFATHCTS